MDSGERRRAGWALACRSRSTPRRSTTGQLLRHGAVVDVGMGGDDHREVRALERVLERDALEAQLGHAGTKRSW